MIKSSFIFSLGFIVSFNAFAEVPVVDVSENFAMLEEQQAELEQPVARQSYDLAYNDAPGLFNEQPLDDEPLIDEEALVAKEPESDREAASVYEGYDHHNGRDNAILLDKVRDLQQEIQDLRGQIEVQAHDLKLLQQQQLAFYKDLDARIRNEPAQAAKNHAENGNKPAASSHSTAIDPANMPVLSHTAKTNPANEQISYLAAYELVKNKKYDQALTAMQTFVYQYPQSGYVANAQYWLGELYLLKKDYPQAIEHFETVLDKHPTSSKNSASLLKIGYALAASGKKSEAKKRLQQVVKNYPDTKTAQLAEAKLQTL